MRNRQRPTWSDEDLARIYAGPHDHRVLGDGHTARVDTSIRVGRAIWPDPTFVADLACGNGAIALGLDGAHTTLGDFAPGFQITGPIEDTIRTIDPVDVMVMCETIEHLDDPDLVLRWARLQANALVCSVPICETPADDLNGEHYWAFDKDGAVDMLAAAGWYVDVYEEVDAWPGSVRDTYRCGIFGCIRAEDEGVVYDEAWAVQPTPVTWTTFDPEGGEFVRLEGGTLVVEAFRDAEAPGPALDPAAFVEGFQR